MSSILRGNDSFDSADYKEHISVPTAYHIYNGEVTATNTLVTNGFSTTLYTGNGTTQSVNTGIDMSTQWGNDASETYGGLTWIKGRSGATSNYLMDTVRGATKNIYSNSTTAETTEATGLTSFTGTGFNIGALAGMNTSAATYASWNFQTTHRKTGTTNHGKAYTEHYNPFTGFTIIKYEGSGIAGHEIPHSLGRKLGFTVVKNLNTTADWTCQYREGYHTRLNATMVEVIDNSGLRVTNLNTDSCIMGTFVEVNASTNQYIMYGWANSYYDEKNTLIGNYEIGVYQGTGAAGNKVTTRGKPAWVMIKRLDSTAYWSILDNQRGNGSLSLYANVSNAEANDSSDCTFESNSFTLTNIGNDINTSGGQYLYMVVYDNDSGSGRSKYPKATDTTNLSINALVPYANGIDVNGSKVSIEYKNETITGLTLTQGKNYIYSKNDGSYGTKPVHPKYVTQFSSVDVGVGIKSDEFNMNTNSWRHYNSVSMKDDRATELNIIDVPEVAFYPFDTDTNDKVGLYNGTPTGTISYSPAVVNNGVMLPAGSYIKSAIDLNNTLTVSGWVKLKNDVMTGVIFGFGGDVGANCILLYTHGIGKYHLAQGSAIGGTLVSNKNIQLNGWVHITIAVTPSLYKLYINGELDKEYIPTSPLGNLNLGFSLGALYNNNYIDSDAEFSNVRVYNSALISSQIKDIYTVENAYNKYTYNYESKALTYLDVVVYADHNGQVEYVEELPKIEYKDVIKANEYQGKNACTAWVNFDGTTTPPTIRDSYNVKRVIRTANGRFNIFFENEMDNSNYTISGTAGAKDGVSNIDFQLLGLARDVDSVRIDGVKIMTAFKSQDANNAYNFPYTSLQVFGGRE